MNRAFSIIVPPTLVVLTVLSFSQLATHARLSNSANVRVAMHDDEHAAKVDYERALIENAKVVNNPAPNPARPSFRLSETPPSGKLLGTLRVPDGLHMVRFNKERAIVRGATDANGFVPLFVYGIARIQ